MLQAIPILLTFPPNLSIPFPVRGIKQARQRFDVAEMYPEGIKRPVTLLMALSSDCIQGGRP